MVRRCHDQFIQLAISGPMTPRGNDVGFDSPDSDGQFLPPFSPRIEEQADAPQGRRLMQPSAMPQRRGMQPAPQGEPDGGLGNPDDQNGCRQSQDNYLQQVGQGSVDHGGVDHKFYGQHGRDIGQSQAGLGRMRELTAGIAGKPQGGGSVQSCHGSTVEGVMPGLNAMSVNSERRRVDAVIGAGRGPAPPLWLGTWTGRKPNKSRYYGRVPVRMIAGRYRNVVPEWCRRGARANSYSSR